jgi:hypothetical protein
MLQLIPCRSPSASESRTDYRLQVAYTWGKAISHPIQNRADSKRATNLAQKYGPTYFNRPHRFIVNYEWDIAAGQHKGVTEGLLCRHQAQFSSIGLS